MILFFDERQKFRVNSWMIAHILCTFRYLFVSGDKQFATFTLGLVSDIVRNKGDVPRDTLKQIFQA